MKITPLNVYNQVRKRNQSNSPEPPKLFSMKPRVKIGQFELGKTLGQGTFGKVKLAFHIPTKEKVRIFLKKGSY